MTFLNRGSLGRLHLKSVHIHGGDSSNHPFMSGIVTRHDKDWIVVSTKEKYSLLIEDVIDEQGNNIINNISPGDRFHTPTKYLDDSLGNKTIYTSKGKKKKITKSNFKILIDFTIIIDIYYLYLP